MLPVLRDRLEPVARACGQLVVVTGTDGRVLWQGGAPEVRRRADGLGFVPGAAWDEPTVGTNAIGTCLVVGTPVGVHGGEHYVDGHQQWTCAAAPLRDPVGGACSASSTCPGPPARPTPVRWRWCRRWPPWPSTRCGPRTTARWSSCAGWPGRCSPGSTAARWCWPRRRHAAASGFAGPARVVLPVGFGGGGTEEPRAAGAGCVPGGTAAGGWLVRLDDAGPAGRPTVALDLAATAGCCG